MKILHNPGWTPDLELGLCEPSGVLPVGEYPEPVGGFQVLLGLLCLKCLLRLGSPHEMGVAVVGLVIHKYGCCPESYLG